MPILVKWDAEREVIVPSRNSISPLHKQFQHGKEFYIEHVEQRSMKAHDRFFAALHHCWDSMPEHIVTRFINATHLRKFALIRCGWVETMRDHPFDTPEAAALGAMCAKTASGYSLVVITGCIVTVYQARSMQISGEKPKMTAKEFYRAADDVLAFLDELLKIGRDEHEQFRELEDIEFEARVRLGKAHREPLRISYQGDVNADTTVR